MTATRATVRIEATAIIGGILFTVLLLLLMAFSHRFMTRHSTEQALQDFHSITMSREGMRAASPGQPRVVESFNEIMQSMAREQETVSELIMDEALAIPQSMPSPASVTGELNRVGLQPDSLAGGMSESVSGLTEGAPEALFVPQALFPQNLIRDGITSGEAVLLIYVNEKGRCRVLQVLRVSHPDLQESIIEAAENSLFQVPWKNGRIEPRKFLWPITFQASPERVRLLLGEDAS